MSREIVSSCCQPVEDLDMRAGSTGPVLYTKKKNQFSITHSFYNVTVWAIIVTVGVLVIVSELAASAC